MSSQIVTNKKQLNRLPFLKISPKTADMMLSTINDTLYTKKFDNTINMIVWHIKNSFLNKKNLIKKEEV